MLKRDTFVKAIKFLVAGFVFGGVVLALLPDTNASDLTQPTLVIKANGVQDRLTITPGTDVQISWTSSNVSSCTLNNNSWTGLSGEGYSTGPVYNSLTIDGTCSDASGQVVATSKVDIVTTTELFPTSVYLSMKIDENGGKTITLPATNNGIHISWSSTNALECNINGWTPVSGTGWATGPLTSSLTIPGRCLGHNGDSYEDKLQITVVPMPTVVLSVSPKPAPSTKPQTPVMVSWVSTNASSCKAIVANGLENWSTGGAISGSVPVTLTSISFMPSQPNWFGISCVDSTGTNSVTEYADVYFTNKIAVVPACSPLTQKVEVGSPVTVSTQFDSAAGEPSWIAPEGVPASGRGWSFTTKYATVGYKTISLISQTAATTNTCTIEVVAPKPTASITATPNPVQINQPVLVSWNSTASTSCTAITDALMGAGSGYVNWSTYGATSGSMWVLPKAGTLSSPAQNKFGVSCGDPSFGAVNAYTDVKFLVGTVEACKLSSQTVNVNSSVTATYPVETAWTSQGGSPSTGFGKSFTTQFASAGTYNITPEIGTSCTVTVENIPTTTSYSRFSGYTGSMYNRTSTTTLKYWLGAVVNLW